MAHLIDKDALVAEIEKRKGMCDNHYGDYWNGCYNIFTDILSLINTLEVKEVNLKEEIKEVQRNYKTIEEYEGYPCTMYANDIEWIAKYFFELTLSLKNNKAQKGEEV